MTKSERLYRILLKAYPVEYRHRYGQQMAQAFGDQLRTTASIPGFVRLWLRIAADWATSVPGRHWEQRSARLLWRRTWSEEGRRAIFFARCEASFAGHPEITPEDLLLGAVRIDRALAMEALGEAAIRDLRGEPRGSAPGSHRMGCKIAYAVPLSNSGKRALGLALEEANGAGASRAAALHLIGGILREDGSLAAQVLLRHGVDLARIRSRYA